MIMAYADSAHDATPKHFNLARYCVAPSPQRPDHAVGLLFIHDTQIQAWTWNQLRDRCAAWQAAFTRHALAPGDRIAVQLANHPDIPLVLLAACALGFIPVILSPQLKPRELEHILHDCTPSLFVGTSEHAGAIPTCSANDLDLHTEAAALRFHDTTGDTPAYLVYTSGTTGTPRGVLHAHRAVWGRRPMREGWTGIGPDDIVLHAGQLNWTYAMGITVFDTWPVGGRAIIYEGERNAEVWARLLREQRPTIFAAVPGIYRQLTRDIPTLSEDTASLRHGLCAGEALPASLHALWTQRTGKPLFEALGMSEISTYISSGPSTPTHPGSPGRPQQGRRVAVLPFDDGETPVAAGVSGVLAIHRSDPGLMLGYWNRPEATSSMYRGDWFLTGDCAHLDDAGYLWYDGRRDDLINALGYRVGPTEIEALLSAHPQVREAAVTGLTPREGVTVVCAYIVPADGEHPPTDEDLRTYLSGQLADYKMPRVFRVLDELPRNRAGKILRSALHASWTPEA